MTTKAGAVRDQSKQRRRHLYFYSRVFDEATHELAGRLVDISHDEMMLVSEKPIELNSKFRFKLVLPGAIGGRRALTLEAQSRWSLKEPDRNLFDNGFKLVNVSIRDIKMIDRLISNT